MKKLIKSLTLVIAGLVAGVMIIPVLANTPLFTNTTNKEVISEQKAIEIAFNNSEEIFEVIKIELDDFDEDDDQKYKLTLKNESRKVDVEIDAYTGEILGWKVEMFTVNDQVQSMISLEKAKKIALSKAGEGFVVVSFELEDDDEYELELRSDQFKIEVEMNAFSGQITKWEAESTKGSTNQASSSTIISIERAIEIALNQAGTGFTVIKVEFDDDDDDDDTPEYEIELRSSTHEIEVEINAYTGEIKEWEVKTRKSVSNNPTSGSTSIISKERAVEIALNKAGAGFTVIKVEFDDDDDDDDTPEYEIELRSSTHEIEVEINAYTGQIKEWEVKLLKSTSTSVPSPVISRERAIAIAREKIGPSPTFKEIELEYDDNRLIYEIEFEDGNREYEFEIDATTGQILEFEIDD